ncbi:2-dehydropantoate 2-reductase [Metabacillus sp. RGM 3146]|uniref:2-dehydropantoate 2-reductase n=1 Tax=Metabacillus sp. RGM 3146 TaxID=3401092 RepID=UPI003B9BE84F
MDIGIIGGGAIGLLFASYLSKQANITVYTNRKEQADLLNKEGILLLNGTERSLHRIHASNSNQYKEQMIIVTVKQYQLEPVVMALASEKGKQILFLQNGMGHLEMLHALEGNEVYVGTVEHGAKKEAEGVVKHNGSGETRISLFLGQGQKNIHTMLPENEAFPIVLKDDWQSLLERKLLVNACINPLTALLRVPNGMLIENTYYYQLMKSIYDEAIQVLNSNKSDMSFKVVEQVCMSTSSNHSSMLQDIELEQGRNTEVDAIIGYLLGEAEKKKIHVPVLHFLLKAIKGISA